MSDAPGRWLGDPSSRHQYRYHDGTRWTEHVSDNGAVGFDPLPPGMSGSTPGYPAPVRTVYVSAPRYNGLAIASMVLGIVWVYWIGSILAVIFGHVALSQIKNSQGGQRGRGMAIAGVVLGYVGIATLAALIVVVATVGIDSDPTAADCRSDALELSVAENAYHVARGTYATETQLVAEGYLDEVTDLHDVVLLGGGADYRILATSECTNPRIALAGHSSQRNQRAAASGAATAQITSTTSSPVGNALPGVRTARTVSESAAAGSAFATVSIASGSFASG
jgi:hypothetical protein